MGNDPAMTWDHSSRDRERISKDLLKRLEHYREHGFGVLAVEEIQSGEIVGQTGLQRSPIGGVELVAYTARSRWRHGIARESCHIALEIAFAGMHLDEVVAIVRQDNLAAQRLAEEFGFAWHEKQHLYDEDVFVGSLRNADWKPSTGGLVSLWNCEPESDPSSPTSSVSGI